MTYSQPKKVLLVDDHPLLRKGIAQVIAQDKNLTVCGEAGDAATAKALVEQHKPDVALVDISLPDANGIELIKDIRILAPETVVLVLSTHSESCYAERVLRAGAKGYLTKGEPAAKVVEGIHSVLAGKVFVSDRISNVIINHLVKGHSRDAKDAHLLSDREFEVLEMIGNGLQTREIAQRLHLSTKTIETHRENIKRKLGLLDASELLKYAIEWIRSQQ